MSLKYTSQICSSTPHSGHHCCPPHGVSIALPCYYGLWHPSLPHPPSPHQIVPLFRSTRQGGPMSLRAKLRPSEWLQGLCRLVLTLAKLSPGSSARARLVAGWLAGQAGRCPRLWFPLHGFLSVLHSLSSTSPACTGQKVGRWREPVRLEGA